MPKKLPIQHSALDTSNIEHMVCHVGALWRRLLNSRVKALGVSGTEMRALLCISHNPGLTQIQIATLLDVEPQNLQRSLDKLEKADWLHKEMDANDRRIKCLYVTPKAKKIISQIQSVREDVKPQVLAGLDAKTAQLVAGHLSKMHQNLMQLLDAEEEDE